MRLHGAGLAALALGDIEDDSVGMELGSRIAFDRPRGVMLEGSDHKLPGHLRGVDVADPRLGVLLQLSQRHAYTLSVGLSDTVIAADKGCQRDRFRGGERRIPPRPVLDAGYFLAVFALVGPRNLMANELRLGERMLALGQSGEVLGADFTLQSPLLGELALPFAMPLLVAAPVVLLLRGKLPLMVCPGLTCRERLGDRQHGEILCRYNLIRRVPGTEETSVSALAIMHKQRNTSDDEEHV
jgi:hypothetical protein